MKFTYSSGQRPLDGYTLKRGIGHGGFGEVYYAISDGGKEVALKLVRGNLETELRGVAQCLNLKHPNLVGLYDLRTDSRGDHWVIMEYVAGEPLSLVLSRHPQGLPIELAQQWFLALARAVGYLHDHGIVHRDLKPANIFLENGILKVGDYGLAKCMSGSQHHAQTQSVGTVHYMAPEIASGNYTKQIDIYACGVLLYEMLTGHVPFNGESVAEILMKHLTTPPDLSKVPTPFLPVVSNALAKNPAHRYQTMGEMARAVEMAVLPPDQPVPLPKPATRVPPVAAAPKPSPVQSPLATAATVLPVVTRRGQIAELSVSLVGAAVLAGLFAILWARIAGFGDLSWVASLFYLTVAVCWAVLLPSKLWNGRPGDPWVRRAVMLVMGAGVGLGALWLQGWLPRLPTADTWWIDREDRADVAPWSVLLPTSEGIAVAAGYLSYFALAFCVLRWWKLTERRRPHRFSFFPVLAAGIWSVLLLFLWPWPEPPHGIGALVMAAAIVQLVSPWEQPPPPPAKRLRLRYG